MGYVLTMEWDFREACVLMGFFLSTRGNEVYTNGILKLG